MYNINTYIYIYIKGPLNIPGPLGYNGPGYDGGFWQEPGRPGVPK